MSRKRTLFPRITNVLAPTPAPRFLPANVIPIAMNANSAGDKYRSSNSNATTAPNKEKKEARSSKAANYWIGTGRRLQELHTFIHERTRHLAEVRTRAYEALAELQIEETRLEHALHVAEMKEKTSVKAASKQLGSKSTVGKAGSKRSNKR